MNWEYCQENCPEGYTEEDDYCPMNGDMVEDLRCCPMDRIDQAEQRIESMRETQWC